tara:strand:- start:546 stop:1013 length:468 start_codon:yes stop_codon:yes gene_type:complete
MLCYLYINKINILFKILTLIAKIKLFYKNTYRKTFNDNLINIFEFSNNHITYYIRPNNLKDALSNCKFLAIEYKDSEASFDINLTDNHFFMINGNTILDYFFIKWYLKKFKNYEINNNYKINIIDENANISQLKNGNSISIYKNNYIINTKEYVS